MEEPGRYYTDRECKLAFVLSDPHPFKEFDVQKFVENNIPPNWVNSKSLDGRKRRFIIYIVWKASVSLMQEWINAGNKDDNFPKKAVDLFPKIGKAMHALLKNPQNFTLEAIPPSVLSVRQSNTLYTTFYGEGEVNLWYRGEPIQFENFIFDHTLENMPPPEDWLARQQVGKTMPTVKRSSQDYVASNYAMDYPSMILNEKFAFSWISVQSEKQTHYILDGPQIERFTLVSEAVHRAKEISMQQLLNKEKWQFVTVEPEVFEIDFDTGKRKRIPRDTTPVILDEGDATFNVWFLYNEKEQPPHLMIYDKEIKSGRLFWSFEDIPSFYKTPEYRTREERHERGNPKLARLIH